jgi:hypothetical protein
MKWKTSFDAPLATPGVSKGLTKIVECVGTKQREKDQKVHNTESTSSQR